MTEIKEMKSGTFFFWVGFAQSKKYPWADKFEANIQAHLESLEEPQKRDYMNKNIPSLSFAIARGFVWQFAPEGAEYWLQVYRDAK
jgi:hypothetical protein